MIQCSLNGFCHQSGESIITLVEDMDQWLRGWTHDRKVMGSIPRPDCLRVLEQGTLFHIVPVH